MSEILTEQIHYNVSNGMEGLDFLRQFAISVGWTVDTWTVGSTVYLQIWSNGHANQDMCYRFEVWENPSDSLEHILRQASVIPENRFTPTGSPMTNYVWSRTSTYCFMSLPSSTFNAMYLYGNKNFITAIFHTDPVVVQTLTFGTFNLLPSWHYYEKGLNYIAYTQYWNENPAYKWYNIAANLGQHYIPNLTPFHSSANVLYWEGAARRQYHFAMNYQISGYSVAPGGETGSFNLAKGMLNYNAYTSKRTAFHPSVFAMDPILLVWYPIGSRYEAYINGKDLAIGDIVKFGSAEYRCFPGLSSNFNIWQAYRIS